MWAYSQNAMKTRKYTEINSVKLCVYSVQLCVTFFFFTVLSSQLFSQEIKPNGYNIFYYDNGQISSEGTLKNGKPDAYWKTYNTEGILVSEGNRKDFLLDSTWKFYDDQGVLKMEINYKAGIKNGSRITYRENETIDENFENDIKKGIAYYYYPGGKLKKTIFYIDGLEDGLSMVYDTTGLIIEIVTYKKGFVTNRDKINRYDSKQKRHGKWKFFYDDGALHIVGTYKHGLKHGYFKEYDIDGSLLEAAKYENGEKQMNVTELQALDVKTEYYPSGKVKIKATYKDEKPEGIWREYNEEGEVERSFIYKNGVVIGEGIISEKGEKNGFWKEYYDSGDIKSEGNYSNDIKTGNWKFFHKGGKLEQIGKYDNNGLPEGLWKWYYSSGLLLREESYYEGLPDGISTEYDELGEIITNGEYIGGEKEGPWFYEMGDHREEGSYSVGEMHGDWLFHFNDGTLSFEGRFIEGNPHGKHVWYWKNGNKKDEGYYMNGRKHGQWTSFDSSGLPFIVVTYDNGIEKKYDGIKIIPEFIPTDFE
ncbi:toxin-antitoxin system YwqK family antitoxin [Bacteroidota bacterium]